MSTQGLESEGRDGRPQAWLVAANGPLASQRFPLRAGSNVVGSSPRCDVVLEGPSVAEEHARLDAEEEDGTWTVHVTALGRESVRVLPANGSPPLPDFADDDVAFALSFRGQDDAFRARFQEIFQGGSARMHMAAGDSLLLGETRFELVVEVAAAAREVVGWIVALDGKHKGADFRLKEGKNVIGSDASCEICITDESVSSRHAILKYVQKDGERIFILSDLDSANGTYLNDSEEPIAREELVDNDTVTFGRTRAKLKCL